MRGDVEYFYASVGTAHQDNIVASQKRNRDREVLENMISDCFDEFAVRKVVDIESVKQIGCDKVFLPWRYCRVSANSNILEGVILKS